MRSSASLGLILSVTIICSYWLAYTLDILPSALPEPWRTFSLLSLLAPAWFTLASSVLALTPATPKEADKNWLVLLNTTWFICVFLSAFALITKGVPGPVCAPCTPPLTRRESEISGPGAAGIGLFIGSFFIPLYSLLCESGK
jgi:hypothetical protein